MDAVDRLRDRLGELQRHEIIVELARIVAMVGDGHTRLWLTPSESNRFRQYPVLMYFFGNDLHVYAIDDRHAAALGGRLVSIGDTPIEEVLARVRAVVHRDNEMTIRQIAHRYLGVPEVLHALRIIDQMDLVTYEVELASGRRLEVALAPVEGAAIPSTRLPIVPRSRGVSLATLWDGLDRPSPLWIRDALDEQPYTLEWLADANVLYVSVRAIRDGANETFEQFFARAYAEADRRRPNRMVLDLRLNGGGNNRLNRPALHGLLERPWLNAPGRFFVLMGRHTFSAASNLVTLFEEHTQAVFVGEPTGARPNHYGDALPIALPSLGVSASVSSLYWQDSLPWDFRAWSAPDLSVPPTFASFAANEDPALELVVTYRARRPLPDLMREALGRDGWAGALRAYERFVADPINEYADTEESLVQLGSELLGEGAETAMAVFELNASAHASSTAAHERLGNTYRLLGRQVEAIRAYERAVALDPANRRAHWQLGRLRREAR